MTTVQQLRAWIAQKLAHLIGTYSYVAAGGQPVTVPAVWVGDPPSTYTVAGLEIRINPVPGVQQIAAHQTGVILEEFRVRVISHGSPSNQLTAVRALLSRWPDAQAQEVPENEALGILAQHLIIIPA